MPKNEVDGLITDQEKLRRKEERREQVLDRLWELAKLSPEITRNSITGQVKAIQMIVAIEGMIPDRRSASSEKSSAPIVDRGEPSLADRISPSQTTSWAPDAFDSAPGARVPFSMKNPFGLRR
ncbi:MAG: hypothetical protein WCD57_06850 [Acidobacteriaceae bacterium]